MINLLLAELIVRPCSNEVTVLGLAEVRAFSHCLTTFITHVYSRVKDARRLLARLLRVQREAMLFTASKQWLVFMITWTGKSRPESCLDYKPIELQGNIID